MMSIFNLMENGFVLHNLIEVERIFEQPTTEEDKTRLRKWWNKL